MVHHLAIVAVTLLLNDSVRQNVNPSTQNSRGTELFGRRRNKSVASIAQSPKKSEAPLGQGHSQKSTPPPPTKRLNLSLRRTSPDDRQQDDLTSDDFLSVSIYQVEDTQWWKDQETKHEHEQQQKRNDQDNPYGARCWPSSMAVAEYMIQSVLPSLQQQDTVVLELGCGPGIPSLAAAANSLTTQRDNDNGSGRVSVIATDVSPTTLLLARKGWEATQKRQEKLLAKKQQSTNDAPIVSSSENRSTAVDLTVRPYDVCSAQSLPFSSSDDPTTATKNRQHTQYILVACSVLYEPMLSVAVAKRVAEAIRDFDAWVILGDDVSGERGSGRAIFWDALQKEYPQYAEPSSTTTFQIKNPTLGWQAKETRIVEWNKRRDQL